MVVEDVLDLDAVDVLAAADQHVLGAVDDEAEALLVEPREVAGLDPAVDEGLGGGLAACSNSPSPPAGPCTTARRPRRAAVPVALDAHDLQVGDRHGGAAAVGRVFIVLGAGASVAGGRGLGHAPAVARRDLGKVSFDLAHQLRRRGRAAIGDALQRGEVVVARAADARSAARRWSARRRPSLTRSRSISSKARTGSQRRIITSLPPAEQRWGSAPRSSRWRGRTAPTSSVERCGAFGSGAGGVSPRRRKARAGRTAAPADVGVDVAVGAERALRLSGRAGGVEDGGVVLRLDLHVRQGPVGQPMPRRAASPMTSSSLATCGSATSSLARLTKTRFRSGQLGRCSARRSSRSASTMATLAPELVEAVFQLRPGPPGVQRRDDRADERRP